MNKNIKKILRPAIFLTFAILPFISATQTMSMGTFLDSFENPEFYICVESDNNLIQSAANDGDYIIIQKSTHPGFIIDNNDNIIYIKNHGELACETIHHTNFIGGIKRYYTTDENNQLNEKPIYEGQIVGKIVRIVDHNPWNSISIKIWDVSIHQLNINALLTEWTR